MEIQVNNLTKKISGNMILDDVNIKMTSGKIYGLKGKNGSGKTMLMRAICGLILPTEGCVVIDGQVLGKDISFPQSIGALIETPGFVANYSGYKNLKVLADIQEKINDEKIIDTLKEVGLDPQEKKKYKKYSLGMKQKLGIAAAIMEDPKIIILDEPTNALDENSVVNLRGILQKHRDEGALIIISCHDSGELSYLSDEIFYIENGQIKSIDSVKKGDSCEKK